ncbi:MAG: hypothetical protein R3B48_19290 [Kofleriaceae bacterium]
MSPPEAREALRAPEEREALRARAEDRRGAALAALLLALAAWAAWTTARAGATVPGDDAWRRAAAEVRASFRSGDLIEFAPPWIDPVGRLHLGDLIPLDAAGRMDDARFGRVWVLSIRGADAPELAGARPALTRELGGVTIRRYDRAPAVVLDDAARALPTAQTSGVRARGPELVLAELGFTPRRCVQVVPAPGGAVTIAFPKFTLGAELVGYAGLADIFTRRDVRDPGELEVRVNGEVVARARLGVDDGWVRFAAATQPGPAEVTVVARAPSPRARDRLICFALESRR